MKKIGNKTNKENNLIEDDGFNPELETVHYDLILNEKETVEKWLKCLEQDFKRKIEKFKPLATINNWILPDLNIFPDYVSDLEKKLQDKYKDNPEILIQKYDDKTERFKTHSTSRVTKELYPIVFETYDGPTIHFFKPEIPESYILDWMEKTKKDLIKRGLISSEPNIIKSLSIPFKTNESSKHKTIKENLKILFFEKNENYDEFNDILNRLQKQELLSEDKLTWIGKGMNGKIQLASLIKWIGISRLRTKFQEKEVISIGLNNFNMNISQGSVKKANESDGEYYLK